jgi:hypothetical protein
MGIAIIVIFVLFALSIAYMLIKNNVTHTNRLIIIEAIFKYKMSLIEKHIYECEVNYEDMELYDKTFNRFWDWGYKRILPKEKLEIIEPFIEHKKGKHK